MEIDNKYNNFASTGKISIKGRKKGRKEGRKKERKEGRKEGRKVVRMDRKIKGCFWWQLEKFMCSLASICVIFQLISVV